MKICFFILCLASTITQNLYAQRKVNDSNHNQEKSADNFPDFNKYLLLETNIDTTANVSFGDFDGDGHLDILLVKGRHWPIVDKVILGDGKGGIKKAYNLGEV